LTFNRQEDGLRLGCLTIWPPTTSESRCSIFEDLADLFGAEYSHEAVRLFKEALGQDGVSGRVSVDAEAGHVAIFMGKAIAVDVALAILTRARADLARPSDDTISAARREIAAWKKPTPRPWKAGDFFSFRLRDGAFAFGQVLADLVVNARAGARQPTCVLLEAHATAGQMALETLASLRPLAILHVSQDHLDSGRWVVMGNAPPVLPAYEGPCGHPFQRGGISWDGLEELAHAWFGLAPWNAYADEDYLDRYLLPGVLRPNRRP